MGVKGFLSRPLAAYIRLKHKRWEKTAVKDQLKTFENLIVQAKETTFGKDHDFKGIRRPSDFINRVPIRDYEALSPYIKRITEGEHNVLWPGKPIYFAKTSGTTSGTKYIPITKQSIPNHINTARDALLSYISRSGNSKFVDGKMIFLSGSPELEMKGGIHTGRLSGIVNHHVPGYLRRNQLPSYETNIIEDWEEKLESIINETGKEDMRLISGIPPWVQMYFDKLEDLYNKKIGEIFPNFSLFVHGGVNYQPYAGKLTQSIGRKIDTLETYPASEGFIAFQDDFREEGLLLNSDSGIYFEFIPLDEYGKENATRVNLEGVEIGKHYALILNNNAGLWGYSIGDSIKFISKNPYKVLVTGRVKHFISAFGEHVIAEEVEKALERTLLKHPEARVVEFTVAPNINPSKGQSHHEWLIEFARNPVDIDTFSSNLDKAMQDLNIYYKDLIEGSILSPLKVNSLKENSFQSYMKSIGKLGGQNKVPRLGNDRKLANALLNFLSIENN